MTVDVDLLERLAEGVRERNADAAAAREARDNAIRAALSQGMTAYRVAQVTGLDERGVGRIRDKG